MTIALLSIGFIALGLAFELATAAKAPMGYQDETGFHFGRNRKNLRRMEAR